MSSIDERIVELRMDSDQFENSAKSSIKILDSLKKALNLDSSAKSLDKLEKTANDFSMDGMARSIDVISKRFSTLGVIGTTALVNITNSAISTGKQLIKSLSVDNIASGWTKYEQKTASVQTIVNATGKSVAAVNKYLDKLMWFSDETSYGFTDMTSALGQLTASGADIDKIMPMITGIANATAYAGKGANEFSRAIYNLNQSYGSGYLQYMDWKSLELAGVASKELKQTFIDTGVALGKIKEGEVNVANFSETLKDKWADTSVMEAAFSKFSELSDAAYEMVESGDADTASEAIDRLSGKYSELAEKAFKSAQEAKSFTEAIDATKDAVSSGWMDTFDIIFGNYEEAKVLWTDLANALYDAFASGAEARNELLTEWKELGGRDVLIEAFWNAWEGVASIINPIKEAFRDIFPPATAQQLLNITEGIKNLTSNFKISDSAAENLKRTFKGVFALLDLALQPISAIIGGLKKLIGSVVPMGDGILGVTAAIGDFIVGIDNAVKSSGIFKSAVSAVGAVITPVINIVKSLVAVIGKIFNAFSKADTSGIDGFFDKLSVRFGSVSELVDKATNKIANAFEKLSPVFSKLGSIFKNLFGKLGDMISNAVSSMNFSSVFDIINGTLITSNLLGIKKYINGITKDIKNVGGILDPLKNILNGVKDSLKAWQKSLDAKTLLKIASAIGILAISLMAISLIDSNKLTAALGAMTGMFIDLFGSMAAFEKITGSTGFKNIKTVTSAMEKLAIAVLILSFAMKNIASLDWNGVAKGLVGIGGLSAILVASAKKLSEGSGKLVKGSLGLIAFAAAIKILTSSVKALSALNVGELTKGLTGVGVLCAELVGFLKFTDFDSFGISKGVGLIALAGAISILANAVGKFAELKVTELGKGLGAVGAVLLELTAFMKLTHNSKSIISTSAGMVILGAAMLIFAKAVDQMGSMSMAKIGKGLLTMAGSLTAVTLALNFMPKGVISKAVGLIGISAALVILSQALATMGSMSMSELGKSLLVLAGSLTAITVALIFLSSALSGAIALLTVAAALTILAPVLATLGGMSLGEIGKSLLSLAGAFTVIGVAGAVLGPVAPAILALSAAIALLGVGCLAASAGLTALAGAGAVGAKALVTIATSLISLIPTFIEKIGEGVVAFAKVITDGAPAICEATVAVFEAIITAITESIPEAVEAILTFIESLLTSIAEHLPAIVQAGCDITLGLLEGINNNLPQLMQAGFDAIISFLNGIRNNIAQITTVAIQIITEFINGIAAGLPDIITAGFNLIISFIEGLADAIEENAVTLTNAALDLAEAIIKGLVNGLTAGVKRVVEAAKNLGKAAVNKIKEFLNINSPSKEFSKIGKFCADGLAVGLGNTTQAEKSAIALGSTILNGIQKSLGIHSPSVVFEEEVGRYIVQGIAEGIDSDTSAEDAITKKAQNIEDAFKTELDRLDLENSIAELSYQLWEKSNPIVSALEKGNKNAELLETKVENQRTKKALANDEYLTMVENFGEGSKEARESREKALEEESTLLDYEQELADARNEQFKLENGVAEDQLQTEEDLADAKYEAWKNDYEATASYEEQAEKQRENLLVHQKAQNERVYQLSLEYQNIVDALGESSDEAKTKLTELTTATTSLKEIGNELADNALYVATKMKENAKVMQEISDLQQEYWETSHPEATEQEKADKSIEFLNTEMQNKAIEFTSSLQEFYDILGKEGFSDNARSTLKDLYSLAVDSQELLNEANEAVKNADTAKKDAYKNYLEIRNKNDTLKQFGYDEEFIEQQAKELSGYNSDLSAEISSSNIENLKELLSAIPEFDKLVANSSGASIGKAISSILEQLPEADLSADVVTGIQNGIIASVPDAAQSVSEVAQAGAEAIKSQQGSWNEAGVYLVEGFIAGIKSKIEAAAEAAASVAKQAYLAAMSELEIHSPSKKFAKLGMYADLGFVKGLERYSERASSASSIMAEDTVDSFSAVIEKISDIINSDSGYEPTVRPVVDASGLKMGMRYINGIPSSTTLDTSAAANRAASININAGYTQADNRKLIQAIDSMSERLDGRLVQLEDAYGKMRLVMDTGVVAGQLQPALDSSFGRAVTYKERGM